MGPEMTREGGKRAMRTILTETLPGRLMKEEIRKFEPLVVDGRMVLKCLAVGMALIAIVSILFVLGD